MKGGKMDCNVKSPLALTDVRWFLWLRINFSFVL